METVFIAIGSAVLYVIAYRTYGRYLARKVFGLDPSRVAPSVELEDGVDFVPSRRDMVFGHHFTSIAGTGPIVGPAVAVVWGWVPALVWVLVGSIVMGAVHDFGSLVISMRHRGRTIGDLAGDVVGPRVRLLFLLVVLIGLWIVLAVFGLVIATVFSIFESAVIPVFLQIPIAVSLGVWIRRGGSVTAGTGVAVGLMYASIVLSAALDWEVMSITGPWLTSWMSVHAFWTLILLGYVFVASVLPVQVLLQPRDYINAYQLLIAMGLLLIGLLVSRPEIVATAIEVTPEASTPGAPVPSFFPFLFVTIACGAISGFHCMVSSGCSSRQLRTEMDAKAVGYGAMLTEGFLAVLVILACVAGIGMGTSSGLVGQEAWASYYSTWDGGRGLGAKLEPFVRGAANMIHSTGISLDLAVAIMGVFVASFAATTLDTATRLQRYVIAELGTGGRVGVRALGNRYVATSIAVVSAGALALSDVVRVSDGGVVWNLVGAGLGGMLLWPVFGATNQLLAGLALLVVTVWLVRGRRPFWVTAIPMVFMLVMTGWAIVDLMLGFRESRPALFVVTAIMLALECWIVVEGVLVVRRGGRDARDEATAI